MTGVNQVNHHFPKYRLDDSRSAAAGGEAESRARLEEWCTDARPGEGGDGPGEADFPYGKC